MNLVRAGMRFAMDIIKSRRLIYELAKNDFQTRYLGSYLGIFWAFIHPALTVLIFWFVFEVGFRAVPVEQVPFVLWLLCGMLPWFFISDSIVSTSNSIMENAFLVKKVVFRVSILPIVKILPLLLVHLFFIGVLFAMFAAYGYPISLYNFQVFYYLLAALVMIMGLAWLTSALVIFLRDIGQLIAMVLQFGFWLTPIFWSAGSLSGKYKLLIKLNPAYYIIEGYRNSFIHYRWFWEDATLTMYYWTVTLVVLLIGVIAFRKLRPHFADVL